MSIAIFHSPSCFFHSVEVPSGLTDVRTAFTVSGLITRYLNEIAPTKAERTYRDNLKESKYLRAAFGEARPEEIKPRAIYAYLDAQGRTSETRANREGALLSHMFTKAIRWGLIDTNLQGETQGLV
jgi:hypothetical protein